MADQITTLAKTCQACGGKGTATYKEEDQTGRTTQWIDASGSYFIGKDGKAHCKCEGIDAPDLQ